LIWHTSLLNKAPHLRLSIQKFMVVIIDYEDQYHKDFQRLNLEWLEKFNLVESHDLEVLNHPRENVLDKGGFIFILKDEDAVIGTAGIYKVNDEEFELIKMYVAPEYRGKKYGEMLLQHCLAKAKEMNASKIILYSNSKLQTAIRMYERFGFKHVDVINVPFETADVKMELVL
jgi:N-acetylglutamate synthase-like GNAT family acetyltransferase